jgi:MerR family copper efflux transcriptional regulator
MRIGELAAQAGTSRDTIRFYERVGLLHGRRLSNGYRDFPPETVAWLHYVRTAQRLGFSLDEIGEHGQRLLAAPDSAAELSALLAEKIRLIDARVAALAELRADLADRVGTGCPLRPVSAPGGRPAGGGGRTPAPASAAGTAARRARRTGCR